MGGKAKRKTHQSSSSEDHGFFNKQDLMDCFASSEFARHVVAAVDPHLDRFVLQINKNSSQISKHENEIQVLKRSLNEQAEKLAKLELKVSVKERNEKLCILRFTGLPEGELEASKKLVDLCKNELDVPLNENDFLLQKPRAQSTSSNRSKAPLHIVKFFNMWTRRAIYKNRTKLKGTNVFISEPLTKQQQALFFRCRTLCRARELKSTWTYESIIYVRSWDGTQRAIKEEGDLRGLSLGPNSDKNTPFTTPQSSMSDVADGSFHGFPNDNIDTPSPDDPPGEPRQHQQPPEKTDNQQHQQPPEETDNQEDQMSDTSWVNTVSLLNVTYVRNVYSNIRTIWNAVCVNVCVI